MALLTDKQNIDDHNDCTLVLIHQHRRDNGRMIHGLYCENHGCLIKWVRLQDVPKLWELGVEDLGIVEPNRKD